MLQLGSDTFEVDGVTVFRDHADPTQFWYLATQVALGRRPDGRPAFSFIKFRQEVADAGIEGGGFLMFEAVVQLPRRTRDTIMGRLAGLVPDGGARLAPAPVERGTVRVVALDLEGPGGTTAAEAPPGAFTAVTKILGATTPSLTGEETAAFSLVLDREGAIILEQAFAHGLTPIGVVYELEYSGLTPDLKVEITADLERVYTHFSASLEAQVYWVRAGIDAGFEKLVQDGAIQIKVIDFDGTADREAKEKWALDFFKNDLLAKWFEPSLDLGRLQGADQPEGLDAVLERLRKLGRSTPSPTGTAGSPGTEGPPGAGAGATGPAATAATGAGTGAGAPPAATLTVTRTTPSPLPAGYGVSLVPGSHEQTETLRVEGRPGATVTVDGRARVLDGAGTVSVDVPAGTTLPVTVDWPASPPADETFTLGFTFDQPREQGFS
ncbi:hypothetical protein, partial [Microbispora triticiradicis]|uniref:hypothetical protein n=1 Tax=Microbispora triticiradicis TaxID=2200763 RepID=UPI001AD78E3B